MFFISSKPRTHCIIRKFYSFTNVQNHTYEIQHSVMKLVISVQMKLTDGKHDEKTNVITTQKTSSFFWNNIYKKRRLTK